MSRFWNIFNNILSFVITIGLVVIAIVICNNFYVGNVDILLIVAFMVLGAVISGFLATLMHELGHLCFSKIKKFNLLSFSIWFFRWTKYADSVEFSFTLPLEEAGSCELVAKSPENLAKRYKWVIFGGFLFSFIVMIIGILAFVIPGLPYQAYCVLVMFLPMGAWTFFGNFLPMSNGGVKNDGAEFFEIIKNTDGARVTEGLLAIQSELYNGKTPSEIDESYYFNLPQLPEDDYKFLLLLNARYYYYLDKGDFEQALLVEKRALGLIEYMPKSVVFALKTDALYDACILNKNEERADDLMCELEKYLNKYNTPANLRAKMAYLAFVTGETDNLERFYNKAQKEALKCQIKGLGKMESRLVGEVIEKSGVKLSKEDV